MKIDEIPFICSNEYVNLSSLIKIDCGQSMQRDTSLLNVYQFIKPVLFTAFFMLFI